MVVGEGATTREFSVYYLRIDEVYVFMMGSNEPILPWSNICERVTTSLQNKQNINEIIAGGNEFNLHIRTTSIYI